jgi:hypothetical protein
MQAKINMYVVDIYQSKKNDTVYLTAVDMDNGEKIKLILPGLPDCKEKDLLVYEGELTPGQYGFRANGILRRNGISKEGGK